MSSIKGFGKNMLGRLGNQLIRNTIISILCRKHDLAVKYYFDEYYTNILNLGIELFNGNNFYDTTVEINDSNIDEYIKNNSIIYSNIIFNGFFQSIQCSELLYTYFRDHIVKSSIENKNPFKERYNTNNDVFIHIRLGDVISFNPGFTYYDKAISMLEYDNGYISSDSPDHELCKQLLEKYPNLSIINYDEVKTIQFGTTCKNLILSHGSFSAVLGYLGFYSLVYYPEYNKDKMWYGDMFNLPEWNKIEYL